MSAPRTRILPGYNVFTRRDGTIRHFWSGEMGAATADPGQDPRGAPDIDPLWTILDTTPEGRGKDWYPRLELLSRECGSSEIRRPMSRAGPPAPSRTAWRNRGRLLVLAGNFRNNYIRLGGPNICPRLSGI